MTEDNIYTTIILIFCCYNWGWWRWWYWVRGAAILEEENEMNRTRTLSFLPTIHSYYYHHYQQHFSQSGMAGWTGWNKPTLLFYLFFLALLVHWNITEKYTVKMVCFFFSFFSSICFEARKAINFIWHSFFLIPWRYLDFLGCFLTKIKGH